MAMQAKSRTWVDDTDKLFHTEITVTLANGDSHTFEGKGESLRASRREAQLIYDAFLEDEATENAYSSHAASIKLGARNDSPDSITQKPRDLPNGSANANVNINARPQPLQPPSLRSKPIKTLLRSQPAPTPSRSEPLQRLPRNPADNIYDCLPGAASPQSNQNAHYRDMHSHYRNSSQVHRPSRSIGNNGKGLRRPPNYPSYQGEENIWIGNRTGSASTGSCDRRSKKIKTNKERAEMVPSSRSLKPAKCEEELVELDDTGECYMSNLNQLKPKIQHLFDKYNYKCVQSSDNPSHWLCTMTMRDLKASEGKGEDEDEVLIVMKKRSKSKKEAKQVAAKCLIDRINAILDEAREKGEDLSAEKKFKTLASTQEESEVSILHRWWQKNLIKFKPDITAKQMDAKLDAGNNSNNSVKQIMWKATYIAKLEGLDRECIFHGIDTAKQNARRKAARAAVQEILAMNLPGFKDALPHKKEACKSTARRDELCPENTKEMVQLSDEEDNLGADHPVDQMFSLLADYVVVIAKRENVCDDWVAKLLQKPMDVGFYVDSVFMRKEMLQLASKIRTYDSDQHDKHSLDCRVICMATEETALLICMDYFTEIPNSVCGVLADDNIRKLGMWPDASKVALTVNYKVNMSSICNLSMDSFSLCGTRKYGIWHSLESIVKLWMKQSFQPFAKASIDSITGMQELIESTDALVAPAVLAAAVGPRVDKYFKQMAASNEKQLHELIVGFQDISERLTAPSIHSRGRMLQQATGY